MASSWCSSSSFTHCLCSAEVEECGLSLTAFDPLLAFHSHRPRQTQPAKVRLGERTRPVQKTSKPGPRVGPSVHQLRCRELENPAQSNPVGAASTLPRHARYRPRRYPEGSER